MELFLNLLWALIALVALVAWRCEWKRHECVGAHKPWQQWTAFACALVFLFFAVSMSDDLHSAAILADDSALGRHHSVRWSCGCATCGDGRALHQSTVTLPAKLFFESDPLARGARVTLAVFAVEREMDLVRVALRGPPVDSL